MQTETALETVLNDVMQPRFKKFRASFYSKVYKLLGYKGMHGSDPSTDAAFQKIKTLVDGMADGKIHPAIVYRELLEMKKVQDEKLAEEAKAKEAAADSAAVDSTAKTDTTAVDTVATVDTTAAVNTPADTSAN
jgi:hypothetical protein